MDNTFYFILGALFVLYLIVTITTRNKSKKRKSRKFMEDYKRKDKEE
ncbi:hypothetical protein FK220_000465 [Flavobacteriaceae bacterium TP-CH-4]|uniref:Uncharacterized protein n=1 Tax=Pelagihabitans pacificus TaxID=2696054 RepID=A0A967AUE8_9FLAO|nr:hypothetical protein [Pelagihabitans pacificus]NHF57792.1 hypothetical protein [Pelagihabitans pacificus]